MRFLEFSFICYDDFKTILENQDQVYKEFRQYAKEYYGFDETAIKNFFYGEIIPACKDWVMDEKLENIKDDFE